MKACKLFRSFSLCVSLLLLAALLAGCTSGSGAEAEPSPDTANGSIAEYAENNASESAATWGGGEASHESAAGTAEQMLEGLTEDEYDGLVITAAADENTVFPAGSAIPVQVSAENLGEETIVYVLGSGSFSTPIALFVDTGGLQAVIPQDRLGVSTMDYQTRELAPGESLEYTLYIMAIEPHDRFDDYTYELSGEGLYIAQLEWNELSEQYGGLVAAQPGEYSCTIYFRYYLQNMKGTDESTVFSVSPAEVEVTDGATGYTKTAVTIAVAEEMH